MTDAPSRLWQYACWQPHAANQQAGLVDPSRTQTEDYLEGLLEGFVAYDASWRVTYMNAAAERLLGRRREDVLGRTWHEAFPHAVGNPVDQMFQRVMSTRTAERTELFYQHYGCWFEINVSPMQSGGIAVYFRDISDRSQAHQALQEETQSLETLNRVGKMLAAELDLERVVQAVTDAATQLSGAAFGSFFYNVKNEKGESYLLYTLSGVPRDAFAQFPMPRNTQVFAPTFAGAGIVRSDDITKDPRYGRNAPHRGQPEGHLPVRSYLAVPVVSRSGEVLGGLFFGHPRPGVFTARAEQLVSGIASQAAVAIDNARLYRDLQRSKDDLAFQVSALTRLHDLAVQLGGLPDLPQMLRATLECIAYLHGTARGLFSLYDAATGALEVIASMGMDDATLEQVRRVTPGPNAGACGSAFALRQRVIVEDTELDQCFLLYREIARAAGFRAVHSTPVVNRAGDILGVVSVHFDEPRRPSEMQMKLADMCARYAADAIEATRHRQGLQEADRRKDEFLAVLAHELRNPLAPLRNGIQLLRLADRSSDAAEQARAMMERQMKHLVRLVDDLMDVSRVSTGKLELQKETVELAAVIGSAIETSRPLIDAKAHRLRIDMPAESLSVCADPVRLSQVLANLLNNAAKYTGPGGEIVLQVQRHGGDVLIQVRDSGIGIDQEMLPRIFDKFTQVDTTSTRAHGGLGIGLTLARTLVELHGGTIEARSPGRGRGSEFVVRLPLLSWRGASSAQAQRHAASAAIPRRRVLIVDDNCDAAESLAILLKHMGHEVRVASDGESAIAAARSNRPDVLFLDISMPGMDGYEVASSLRGDARFAPTKIVAMTGHGQDSDRRRSREAGFDAHVVKPVEPERLSELLSAPR